jgi:hypothetical protein
MGMQMPSDPSMEWPAEPATHGMFSMLAKKLTTLIKGKSEEEKDHDLKESTVVFAEDATEPWEVIPAIKDDPWAVIVVDKQHQVLATFDDGNGNRQSQFERTYQYEFERRVQTSFRLARREADMRAK